MNTGKEIWKDIKGYPKYKISTLGRVKSFHYHNGTNERILSHKVEQNGYERVGLIKNRKQRLEFVHRLVALAFIPNHRNKPQVNHKDGNKHNNTVSNLEWMTPSENQKHAFMAGISVPCYGEKQGNSKLQENDVLNIRAEYRNGGMTQKELSDKYHVDQSHISNIVNRKVWAHV